MAVIHPAFDALAALVDHEPTSVTQSTLLDHVGHCGRCAEDVDWVRQVTHVMRMDDSLAAPPHVIRRAVRIISTGALLHSSPSLRSIGRCLIARLRFDSAAILAPQGLRAGTGESRRRIYEASPFELDILASPRRSGWALCGQVLGAPENQSGTVTVSGTNTRTESTLNEMLEFQVAALLPSGTYKIEVQLGSTQLQIPWLELGP